MIHATCITITKAQVQRRTPTPQTLSFSAHPSSESTRHRLSCSVTARASLLSPARIIPAATPVISSTFFSLGHVIVFRAFLTPNQNAAAKITFVPLVFPTARARDANETTSFFESPFSPNSSHQFTKMPSPTALTPFSLLRGPLFTVVFLVVDDDSSEVEIRSRDEQQDEAEDEDVPQPQQEQVILAGQGEREPETISPVRELQPGQMMRRTWREKRKLEAWNLTSQERQR